MQNRGAMGARMLEILMRVVSTRNYKKSFPAMAETAGVSRSAVSRRVAEASEPEVEALLTRRFDDLKLLVIYVDGLVFGDYSMQYPSAAASLLEGLEECFTINRLDLPPSLHRCLATTDIIESPHAGVRIRTSRVTTCRTARWFCAGWLWRLSEPRSGSTNHGPSRSMDPGSDPLPCAACLRQGR
jgi:transposase-like protein